MPYSWVWLLFYKIFNAFQKILAFYFWFGQYTIPYSFKVFSRLFCAQGSFYRENVATLYIWDKFSGAQLGLIAIVSSMRSLQYCYIKHQNKKILNYKRRNFHIFPTKSNPGLRVLPPGFQLAGHTIPLFSATNFAA